MSRILLCSFDSSRSKIVVTAMAKWSFLSVPCVTWSAFAPESDSSDPPMTDNDERLAEGFIKASASGTRTTVRCR